MDGLGLAVYNQYNYFRYRMSHVENGRPVFKEEEEDEEEESEDNSPLKLR